MTMAWRDSVVAYIRAEARPVDKFGHQPRVYALAVSKAPSTARQRPTPLRSHRSDTRSDSPAACIHAARAKPRLITFSFHGNNVHYRL